MRYSICCLLRGKFAEYHSKLVEELGNKFEERYLIENPRPCHITLKYPFEEKKNIEEVEKILEDFVRDVKVTKLKIDSLNQFNNKVVVFEIDFSKDAKEVFNNFQNELKTINWLDWREYDNISGKWHLTLVYGNTIDKFNSIWKYVNENIEPNFELKFDNLTILKEMKPNVWEIHKIFEIG